MAKNPNSLVAILSLFLLVSVANRTVIADESGADDESRWVWSDRDSEQDDVDLQFAVDSDLDSEFVLVQEGATDSPEVAAPPLPSRSEAVAARRRRSTYRLPSMFGDYYGGSVLQVTLLNRLPLAIPSGGTAVRRVKVAENNSPMPRNRIIANYNFFNDVFGGIGDVNRYTVGFEQTFFEGSSSIQVMFPFASTLGAEQVLSQPIAKDLEFGNASIIFKSLLVERDEYALAGGLGVTLPTGRDVRVFDPTGFQAIHIDHASVHLLPYLALHRGYDSGWYWQSFLQLDIDVNGDRVRADPQAVGLELQRIGVLQEQTLLFADVGVGYRFNDLEAGRPAVAATAELHYTTTLQDADAVSADPLQIRNLTNRFDVLNLTLGLDVRTNHRFSIRPAMVVPLRTGDDEQFDFEALVQLNYWR